MAVADPKPEEAEREGPVRAAAPPSKKAEKRDSPSSPFPSSSSSPSTPAPASFRRWFLRHPGRTTLLLSLFTHALSILLYLRPLTRPHPSNPSLVSSPRPVLDESHIVSPDNADVRGTSALGEVWTNDYWGRPMKSASSHRSWRPLTVLSFRWGKLGGLGRRFGWGELFAHRLVNVLIHATVAELASIVAVKLFPYLPHPRSLLLRSLVKLLFALHPTHVECTANAANRPHILSLMFSAVACDPDVHVLVMGGAVVAGLLCSETAVFQLPAVLVTMTAIRWRSLSGRGKREGAGPPPSSSSASSLLSASLSLLPRHLIVASLALSYLGGRYLYDTLSIPDGLIRPAENPYYSLSGLERASTYSLVLSVHVGKALGLDWVGFSHEYGFDCVRKVPTLNPLVDPRLWIPAGMVLAAAGVTCECVLAGTDALVLWAAALSWSATLFPVSGFVKVGTSIADRIAVPSTFAAAIFGGRMLTWFVADFGEGWFRGKGGGGASGGGGGGGARGGGPSRWRTRRVAAPLPKPRKLRQWTAFKSALVALLYLALWRRTDRRSAEWMDSVSLLESSLKSCPRSAKSNLEMSKIYSGLYPEKFDLEKALSYLRKVEEIDPDYCDVHQQFAHCHIQQGRYLEFEERLTKSVMCPFTMGGAVPLWQRYWKAVTSDPATGEAARRRMDRYQTVINEAVQKEMQKEEEEKRKRRQREGIVEGEL